jgi:hypothetical protein
MKRNEIKILGILLLSMVGGLLFFFPLAKGKEVNNKIAGNEIIVAKGALTTERCLKEPACYLEWYDPSSLVIFTAKRTVYHLDTKEIPGWKLNSGFGRQVAIKGILKGNKLIVNDLLSLEGGGKLSKACL